MPGYSNGNSFGIEPLTVLQPPVSLVQRAVAGGIAMSFPPCR